MTSMTNLIGSVGGSCLLAGLGACLGAAVMQLWYEHRRSVRLRDLEGELSTGWCEDDELRDFYDTVIREVRLDMSRSLGTKTRAGPSIDMHAPGRFPWN